MTLPMSDSTRHVHLRPKAFLMGLVLGVYLAAVGLVAGGALVGARTAQAQVIDGDQSLCMDRSECISLAVAKGGDCDGKHCFESGHGCTGASFGYCYGKWTPVKLVIGFGGITKVTDIGDLMVKFYDWSMGIAAVIAAVMMMVGGFMVLTSGGGAGGIKKGKTYITNALIGLLILATSYTILQTVNPDLVRFSLPRFPTVKRAFVPQCAKWALCAPCGAKFYVKVPIGKTMQDMAGGGVGTAPCNLVTTSSTLSEADQKLYTLSSDCTGTSCSKIAASCGDQHNKCVQKANPTDEPESNCKPGGGGTANANDDTVTRNCKNSMTPPYDQCLALAAGDAAETQKCKQQLSNCLASTQGGANGNNQGQTVSGTGLQGGSGVALGGSGKACKADADCGSDCEYCYTLTNSCVTKVDAPPLCQSSTQTSTAAQAQATGVAAAAYGDGYYCRSCSSDGNSCSSSGSCCSGKCLSNKVVHDVCSSGEFGSSCNTKDDCVTGVCNEGAFFKGTCTTGAMGALCNNSGECTDPYKCKDGYCSDSGDFTACRSNGECKSNKCDPTRLVCVPDSGLTDCSDTKPCSGGQRCVAPPGSAGAKAAQTNANMGGGTFGSFGVGAAVAPTLPSFCSSGAAGATCRADGDCGSGTKCVGGLCSPGDIGTSCREEGNPRGTCKDTYFCTCLNSQCACTTGMLGSPCDKADDCDKTQGFTCQKPTSSDEKLGKCSK